MRVNPTDTVLVPTPQTAGQTPRAAAAEPAAAAAVRAAVAAAALQLSVVDVLAPAADGRVLVRIDGTDVLATTAERLVPGGRYVLQVERTAAGVTLTPPPAGDDADAAIASAVLRDTRPPPAGEVVSPLRTELAATPGRPAAEVAKFLPESGRPPTADELKATVERGGQLLEAKLARQAAGGPAADGSDFKAGLLKLLAVAPDLAAARAALNGVESQQAANVLGQQVGGPFVVQIPFPDGANWQTLRLAVEPETAGDDADAAGRFRVFLHVPLSDLGEAWVDAGADGDRLRAVLYLDAASARDRVRADLPALRADLRAAGFADVLLDVRPADELTDRQRRRTAAMTAGVPESVSILNVEA